VSDVPPPAFGIPPPSSTPDPGVALSYAWTKFQENAGACIGVVAVLVVVQIALGIASSLALRSSVVLFALLQLLSFVIGPVVALGIVRLGLLVTAGESVTVGKAFTFDRWGEWIVFSIAFGFLVGIGLLLCVLPGLVVLALFGLAPFYFVDRRMGLEHSACPCSCACSSARPASSSAASAYS
jgi:uncharacterized membrane protein